MTTLWSCATTHNLPLATYSYFNALSSDGVTFENFTKALRTLVSSGSAGVDIRCIGTTEVATSGFVTIPGGMN